jgi:Flp pilus assembly protein TadD
VFEARQVPYTAEELALFKQPAAGVDQAARKSSQTSVKELPPGTAALAAEAQRYYANRQFDKAEEKYLQILQQDKSNVPALTRLAAIELDLGHLEAAEINIKQAAALAPNDPYTLFILASLQVRQKNYDAAVDSLSRAAQLDPKDAQIQNLLGLALSEKGLRGPAETALRKAIQLDPGFAQAHNNLAVVYITQRPPLVELARWHYQKALAAGQPPNPDLEKLIEAAKP